MAQQCDPPRDPGAVKEIAGIQAAEANVRRDPGRAAGDDSDPGLAPPHAPAARRHVPILIKVAVLTLPSLVLLVVLLELGLRFVVPASQTPFVTFDESYRVLKYDNTLRNTGTFTVGSLAQQRAEWRINNHGWNSAVDYRTAAERDGSPLIAIIGDSYVEGFHADAVDNLSAVLSDRLGPDYDVYSFGISGAALSQYLHLSRYVREVFRPDMLVVVMIHNDFLQALADQSGSIDQMRLSVGPDGVAEVLPVAREKSRFRRFLGKSALVRYLVINAKLRETLHRLRHRDSRVAANVDVDRVDAVRARIRTAVDYGVQRIREENPDIPVLFMFDGLRRELYAGRTPHDRLTWLHDLMAETAAAHGCAYLDLDAPFRRHYEATGERFETDYNFHWNEVGHRVAAESLLAFIEEKQLLPEPRSSNAGSTAVPRRSHGETDR